MSEGNKKIKLEIVGLSYSQTQSGAYALVLGESRGKRRLPIIIGGFEAQAIAIELEKMTPSRPLTHDLFKSFAEAFSIDLHEVLIYNLVEGIFFARLVCSRAGEEVEIDARTSDAIALAVRFECPIYTYEFILSQAGIILEDETPKALEKETGEETSEQEEELLAEASGGPDYNRKTTKELEEMLRIALEEENYERASRIRDELSRRRSA
ncbi:MAG TPA: bifunctional nuclease family protein [Bacteroidia bacterium]|nr:bifunctional nuclease family protein [Bacteroidia bacterium]